MKFWVTDFDGLICFFGALKTIFTKFQADWGHIGTVLEDLKSIFRHFDLDLLKNCKNKVIKICETVESLDFINKKVKKLNLLTNRIFL